MTAQHLMVQALDCGYAGKAVVRDVSFSLRRGELLCLLGPNGIGKTTLFKSVLGLRKPLSGRVRLDGEDLAGWTQRRRAAHLAYVPQAHLPPFPYQVLDVVVMGRLSRRGILGVPTAADRDIGRDTLAALGILPLERAVYTELSGGQRQLVMIARALAQQAGFLFLDEPTANLDYGNQIRVLNHIRSLAAGGGIGVVMTTHDPNQALLYGSAVAVLGRDGRLTCGAPQTVLTRDLLRETYGVDVRLLSTRSATGEDLAICLPEV